MPLQPSTRQKITEAVERLRSEATRSLEQAEGAAASAQAYQEMADSATFAADDLESLLVEVDAEGRP